MPCKSLRSSATLNAMNGQNLKRLKVGDGVVTSVYRAVAVSVSKEKRS
jgi:hypothetical protein